MGLSEQRVGRQAIVIGASMGGLLAARTLSDFYEQVTILERDAFPAPGQNRKGVPQGQHAHGLLARGRAILEQLFPGLTNELLDQGSQLRDIGLSIRWYNQGDYHCAYQSGLLGLAVSRPTLEAAVRARVLALPNIRAIEQCDVRGIVATDDQRQVTGVRLRQHASSESEELLYADLVVDASGRGSRSPAWLEALGYPQPETEQVTINIGYATRYYRWDPENPSTGTGFVVASTPPNRRGAVLLAQDGDRFVVTLCGYLGDYPPTDEVGFLEFARSLPTPDIYHAIRDATPLTAIMPFRYPASTRRHYARLGRFPEGYLVLGDALCSFNPIYGQGMTARALEALALQECLQRGGVDLAARFFRKASRLNDIPWSLAVGNDLRYPEVAGPRSGMVRFVNWYIGKLHIAAWRDPHVALAFLRAVNLIAPPASLLQPATALRVLWGNLRQPARAPNSGAERIEIPAGAQEGAQ